MLCQSVGRGFPPWLWLGVPSGVGGSPVGFGRSFGKGKQSLLGF